MNKRLKLLREKLGLTQTEFAEKLGISQTFLSSIELGIRGFPTEIFLRLIELNVNIEWLFTGQGEMFKPLPDEKPLVNISDPSGTLSLAVKLLSELPEEQQKDCLHFIQDKKLLLDLQKRVEKLEHKCQITPK